MSRFFFHLYNDNVLLDQEGCELPDVDAARNHALDSARAMACAEVLEGHLSLKHWIDVEDERGEVVLTVHFRDVVEVEA